MTAEQAAALEAAVGRNPDDLDARKKLLDYYHAKLNAQLDHRAPRDPMVVKAAIAAGLPHAFWMIEHHPEDPDTGEMEPTGVPLALRSEPRPRISGTRPEALAGTGRSGRPPRPRLR